MDGEDNSRLGARWLACELYRIAKESLPKPESHLCRRPRLRRWWQPCACAGRFRGSKWWRPIAISMNWQRSAIPGTSSLLFKRVQRLPSTGPDAAGLTMLQQLLAAGADPNQRDPDMADGMSPLMLAARWHDMDALQCLLETGADPNLAGVGKRAGYTALMEACDMDHAQHCFGTLGSTAPMVGQLLQAGADPEPKVRGRCWQVPAVLWNYAHMALRSTS